MTTTADPLLPARVESWLRRESQLREAYEHQAEVASRRPPEEPTDASRNFEYARERNAVFCALLEAHIDATKREPPAGLVEVIGRAIEYCERNLEDDVATAAELAPAIARAVVEFATSDAGISRALVAWFPDYEDDYPREGVGITAEEDDQYRGEMRAAVRAALGATEESK